jgi:ionotropic glutamate receptor
VGWRWRQEVEERGVGLQVEMRGLTGVIKFDHQGFRSDFVLDIIELSKEGLKKIGTWNSTEGVNFTRTYGEAYTQIVEIIQNKTFVVTTILVSAKIFRWCFT